MPKRGVKRRSSGRHQDSSRQKPIVVRMAKSDASAVGRTTGSSVDEDLGVELRKLDQSVVIAITKILQRAKVPEEFHAEILKRIDNLR